MISREQIRRSFWKANHRGSIFVALLTIAAVIVGAKLSAQALYNAFESERVATLGEQVGVVQQLGVLARSAIADARGEVRFPNGVIRNANGDTRLLPLLRAAAAISNADTISIAQDKRYVLIIAARVHTPREMTQFRLLQSALAESLGLAWNGSNRQLGYLIDRYSDDGSLVAVPSNGEVPAYVSPLAEFKNMLVVVAPVPITLLFWYVLGLYWERVPEAQRVRLKRIAPYVEIPAFLAAGLCFFLIGTQTGAVVRIAALTGLFVFGGLAFGIVPSRSLQPKRLQ